MKPAAPDRAAPRASLARAQTRLAPNRAAQRDLAKMAEEMIALVAGRQLDPMVEEVIGLEDIPGALARLQTRHVRGKIVAECAIG